MSSADWTYEDVDKGWVVDMKVTATVVPYVEARTNCLNDDASPADGGHLEDVTFTVTGFMLRLSDLIYEVVLTPMLAEALALEVKRAYDNSDQMEAEVYALFED